MMTRLPFADAEFWTLPNILTVTRLALLPFIVLLMFIPAAWAASVALTLYIIGALTDYLDGWVARKYDQVSEFGTFLDPISDKIYVVTIMMMLLGTDRLNGIFVLLAVIIIAREFLVAGLREYLGPKDIQVPVSDLAKWKTAAQMVAMGILIIAPYMFGAATLGVLALMGATALTAYTGCDYLKAGLAHMCGPTSGADAKPDEVKAELESKPESEPASKPKPKKKKKPSADDESKE